jgi:ribonuclease HI
MQPKCKNCGIPLIQRQTKQSPSRLKKPYYYSAYYYCPNCQRIYHDNKFKVINPPQEKLNLEITSTSNKTEAKQYDAQIWTDGACVFNGTQKAKAAWAFVSNEVEEAGLVPGLKQTNNVAEGLAILNAIRWAAAAGHKKIKIHTDSQISLFNLKKPASMVKENREIFEQIELLIKQHNLQMTYEKVLGHSGDPNNERADHLANTLAAKQ